MKIIIRSIVSIVLVIGILFAFKYCSLPNQNGQIAESAELTPFDAWRQIQTTLRSSPDHLPARAKSITEKGDVEEIYQFVRDSFAVYPPRREGFARDAVSYVKWGPRATLRGGGGTPRDLADLLVELYSEAGFNAQIVQGAAQDGMTAEAFLLSEPALAFRPEVSDRDIARWRSALGYDGMSAQTLEFIDQGRGDSKTLVSRIMTAMPAIADQSTATNSDIGRMPLVKLIIDGDVVYANPLVKDGKFGESYTRETPIPAGSPYPFADMVVTLEGARSDRPYERFQLAQGKWSIADLVGRRVEIRFAPATDIQTLLTMRMSDVETVIPVMRMQGTDIDTALAEEMSIVGNPLTVRGDYFKLESDGPGITINGRALAEPSDPQAAAKVTKLSVSADARAWPRVDLAITALDDTGKMIDGLGADIFSVLDEGRAESFVMAKNNVDPPRIIFMIDRSSSLPDAYRGEAMAALVMELAEQIKQSDEQASFRVGVVNFGVDWQGPWTGDLAQLDAQINKDSFGDSDFWRALADTAEERASLILFVTDAIQDPIRDIATKETEQIVSSAPIIAIGVGDVDKTNLAQMAQLSGGISFLAEDRGEIIARTIALLKELRQASYALQYISGDANAAPDTEREVMVGFDGGRLEVSGSYRIPEAPGRAPGLSGLYLTIRSGGKETTRTIAGYDKAYTTNPIVDDADLEEAKAALFGRIVIGVEGAGPGLSVILDDWYQAKLSLEDLWQAVTASGEEGGVASLFNSLAVANLPPPELIRLFGPRSKTSDVLVYETNAQIVTIIEKPAFGKGWVRSIDWFPFSERAGWGEDSDAAWQATLEEGAHRAIVESRLLGEGTYSLLKGEPLKPVDRSDLNTSFPSLTDGERKNWSEALAPYRSGYAIIGPVDGAPLAFYAINKSSGNLIAIMPDGTGGAREEIDADLNNTMIIIDVATILGGVMGIPTVGVWAALEKTKARLVSRATIMLATGETSDDYSDIAGNLACDLMKVGVGSAASIYSGTAGEVAKFVFDTDSYSQLGGELTGLNTPTISCGF
jgi:hypothetical protein